MVHFFMGLDHPAVAWPFLRSMISINTIRDRKGPFRVNDWIMDSGGFTELSTHGRSRTSPKEYAGQINRWKDNGNLVAAVTQDLMCELFILHKTGLSIDDHQNITVERYARLIDLTNVYVMPVLQGYSPESYVSHLDRYADLLTPGQWVGLGRCLQAQWKSRSDRRHSSRDQSATSRPSFARIRHKTGGS